MPEEDICPNGCASTFIVYRFIGEYGLYFLQAISVLHYRRDVTCANVLTLNAKGITYPAFISLIELNREALSSRSVFRFGFYYMFTENSSHWRVW